MKLFSNEVNGVKVWFILLSIVFCVAIISVLLDAPRIITKINLGGESGNEGGSVGMLDEGVVRIDGVRFDVLVARTNAERRQGLGGRASLEDRQGMLFVFDDIGKQSIWMKEMKFPIDIVWISENLRIVEIKRDATPESYPEVFSNVRPARYVLELPAGSIDRYSLNGLSNIQIESGI